MPRPGASGGADHAVAVARERVRRDGAGERLRVGRELADVVPGEAREGLKVPR